MNEFYPIATSTERHNSYRLDLSIVMKSCRWYNVAFGSFLMFCMSLSLAGFSNSEFKILKLLAGRRPAQAGQKPQRTSLFPHSKAQEPVISENKVNFITCKYTRY
jgi:nitrate/nitrite transporter NarK